MGYNPQGRKELDMIEQLNTHARWKDYNYLYNLCIEKKRNITC